MKIKLTNTGFNITWTFPEGCIGNRYTVEFDGKYAILKPPVVSAEALSRTVTASNSFSIKPHQLPTWPHHGSINVEARADVDGIYYFEMPSFLPAPRPKATKLKPVEVKPEPIVEPVVEKTEEQAPAPVTEIVQTEVLPPQEDINTILIVEGERYPFKLPQSEILQAVMVWGSAGYSRYWAT